MCTNETSTGKKYCFHPYWSDYSISEYLDKSKLHVIARYDLFSNGQYKYRNESEDGSLVGDTLSSTTDTLLLGPVVLTSVEIDSLTNINSFYALAKGKLNGDLLKSIALCWNAKGNPTMVDEHFNILPKEGDFSG